MSFSDCEPPADADPRRFVTGEGSYVNFPLATVYDDAAVFRIDPAPLPVAGMTIVTLVFAGLCVALHVWLRYYPTQDRGVWLPYLLPIGLFAVVAIPCLAIYLSAYAEARANGPWLIYAKATRRLELPRTGLSFDLEQIEHVEYITTKLLQPADPEENDRLSEINLVTRRGGFHERHQVIGSRTGLDDLLQPLLRETGLPAVRVEDEWFGWNVTERPYP